MQEASGNLMHIALFWVSAVFAVALVYPYIIYPVILRMLPKQPCSVDNDAILNQPGVALLFCAYNEECSLPAKIENIRELKANFPDIEVHAYTDACSDGTVELLRKASAIVTVHEGTTRVGKAAGMRELVSATSADVLVFTDANVLLDGDAIAKIMAYFRDPTIGAVAGTLHYTNPEAGQAARTGSLYWRLEETIKRLESESGSTMGADGSIFAMRREFYPDVPLNLLDDLTSSMNPIFLGYRVISAPDVHAYEKATTKSGDEFNRKRRIACRAFNTHRHLAPQLRSMGMLDRFKYVSHKYLRWFSAGFLLLTVVLFSAGIASVWGITAAIVILLAGLLVLGLGRMLKIPVVGVVGEIIMSIIAVGVGVTEALAGRNYQTWSPAKSRH